MKLILISSWDLGAASDQNAMHVEFWPKIPFVMNCKLEKQLNCIDG